MRPNHHQFNAFAHVVREGSFSKAAARLGVTQSTITQHVAKLEQMVGAQLLVRSKAGVSVTRTGQEFYDLADRLVTLDHLIGEKLEGFASLTAGHLSIIANAPQPALAVVKRFTDLHPEVQIDFTLYDWTTSMAMLRNRLVDIALITDPQKSDDWISHKLAEKTYVAYVPASNPLAQRTTLSLRDIVKETVIFPEEGSLTERVVSRALKSAGLELGQVMRTTTFPVMREAVLQGIGIALFLSESTLVREGIVEIPVEELVDIHEVYAVVPRDRASLRLIQSFADVSLQH